MENKLDIEKLFKEKLEHLEGDVNPNVWNGIQQNIGANAGAATSKTGTALVLKKVFVGIGLTAATGTGLYYYASFDEQTNEEKIVQQAQEEVQDNNVDIADKSTISYNEANEGLEEFESEGKRQSRQVESTRNKQTSSVESTKELEIASEIKALTEASTKEVTETSIGTIEKKKAPIKEALTSPETNKERNTATNKEVASGTEKFVTYGKQTREAVSMPFGKLELSAEAMETFSEVNFESNAKNADRVYWEMGDGSIKEGKAVSHEYDKSGDYLVTMTVENKSGDTYKEDKLISIVKQCSIKDIPNVFTPDGDGINDMLSIETTGVREFSIEIIDNRGKKVYESADPNFQWDGRDFNGERVQKGLYTYILIAKGEGMATSTKQGKITIQ